MLVPQALPSPAKRSQWASRGSDRGFLQNATAQPHMHAALWALLQAIMNKDMAERGAEPQEPELQRGHQASAGRFLTGDLSFFGVGSKNAGARGGRGVGA